MNRTWLRAWYYGPLAGWMAFIFVMSTGVGADPNSKDLLIRILERIGPNVLPYLNKEELAFLNYILRKSGHLIEYFVLMALAIRAVQYGRQELRWQSPILAVGLCAAYAASDELHQVFVSGRSGSVDDVLIDLAGAFLCLVIILGWFAARKIERVLWQKAQPSQESRERADILMNQVSP